MNRIKIYLMLFCAMLVQAGYAQKIKSDANLFGHIVAEGEHIPFATVAIQGTTIGTATDQTGHYKLLNLPEGEHVLVVSVVGYKPQTKSVTIKANETKEVNFDLEEDRLNLEEVVVSSDRSESKRTEAPIIVNTISPKLFRTSQSTTLGEGLNFSPGLRLENNCQNCGFSQVRMNGMDGAHSQILINSRPIFSGLAGVYGLELIPANMIERVEVVRGGGSALFGSNAIAGTVNIILKEPIANTYEIGGVYTITGVGVDGSAGSAPDYSIDLNASLVSDDHKTGVSIYGFTRNRDMFDANDDEFSEIAPLSNQTLGTRFFHKFGTRDKLVIDFFAIKEQRDGGSDQEYPYHQRRIAEALTHDMKVGGISYERYFRKYDLLTVYASGQFLDRDSYYGANYSVSDYGNTEDNTYNIGAHYKAVLSPSSSILLGVENTSGFLKDKKIGSPIFGTDDDGETIITGNNETTIVADQGSITTGTFVQYDVTWDKFKVALGGRLDRYEIKDYDDEGDDPKTGTVFSPRASVMYNILDELKARVSYSQGYRAPQIFDEDLHIETSGARQVLHENDEDLKQESSQSIMASLDFNGLVGTVYSGLLVEGFYTKLDDAFANEINDGDEDGQVVYTRVNSGGAVVQGMNLELKLKPLKAFQLTSGFTVQTSEYDDPQDEFNEKSFFRTPDSYGFLAIDWDFAKKFCMSVSGNYTGKMLVPYYGTECELDDDGEAIGILKESDPFYDLGAKLSYTLKLNGSSIELTAGIKNIFNSFQDDFDYGIDRDPAYIYGPTMPRSIYFGVKIGNFL